ncbi:sensor histidine kinase [Micromonospora sp. NPDC003197]
MSKSDALLSMPTEAVPAGSRTRAIWIDVALAGLTSIGVLAGTVLLDGEVDHAGTVPVAAWLGLLLLLRRRWPVPVLLASVLVVIAFRGAGLTEVGWVWPASAAFFTVAAGDRQARHGLAWAAGVGLVALWFAATWHGPGAGGDPRLALALVGAETLWLAVVLAAAAAYRNWHRWQAELAAGLRRLEYERELESSRRSAEERLEIARELHDVVAHTLTVVGVQLHVVAEALDDSPAEAQAALRTAQEVRTKAVADLRSLIGILRDPDPTLQNEAGPVRVPQIDLAGLDDLMVRTRASGLDIALDVAGDPAAVPAPIALAAYRIVQESLTNTVKHANANRSMVRLHCTSDVVEVEVTDNGATAEPKVGSGHGISGMRERVAALGGTFTAGPAAGGGYAVRATIPVPIFRS